MEARPLSDLSPAQVADLFNRSFEDYIGSLVNFTPESMAKYIAQNHLSIPHSLAFYSSHSSNDPIGFACIAIRPETAPTPTHTRLAGMGIVKGARGNGTGSKALKLVLDAEKARGTSVLGFECIQQNEPAVRMYTKAGCTIARELLGWQYTPKEGEFAAEGADPALQACSFDEVDALVRAHGAADLPWQTRDFGRSPGTDRAFRLGGAYCVVTDPEDGEKDLVRLGCLIVEPQARGRGEATRLVKAVMGRFPGKKWMAPPYFPKEYGERIAERLGCESTSLTQFQMEVKLV